MLPAEGRQGLHVAAVQLLNALPLLAAQDLLTQQQTQEPCKQVREASNKKVSGRSMPAL